MLRPCFGTPNPQGPMPTRMAMPMDGQRITAPIRGYGGLGNAQLINQINAQRKSFEG